MDKTRVLFVCAHNSARSQIAEAFLKEMAGDRFDAQSAGLEPGQLNPLAVEAMGEIGIDISRNQTKSVFDFFKRGELFSYVITVCDEKTAEQCPVFPGITNRWHWSFEDPAGLTGSHEEKMERMREIRDRIRDKIEAFIAAAEPSNNR
jgi:arsenate reductase